MQEDLVLPNTQRGKKHPRFKTGRSAHTQGYVTVLIQPEHPLASMAFVTCSRANGRPSSRRVLEHRLVMAEFLGRPLTRAEVVHHIDGDKTNNAIDNLELMTRAEHVALHHPGRSPQ
jgi:hypothetical protein